MIKKKSTEYILHTAYHMDAFTIDQIINRFKQKTVINIFRYLKLISVPRLHVKSLNKHTKRNSKLLRTRYYVNVQKHILCHMPYKKSFLATIMIPGQTMRKLYQRIRHRRCCKGSIYFHSRIIIVIAAGN